MTSVTRSGAGHDQAEAWYYLGECYSESGQHELADEAWVLALTLNETRPVRHWHNVHPRWV